MSTTRSITTAEQLQAAGDLGRCELVRGELIMMSPAGGMHGRIVGRLATLLTNHVEARRLGVVLAAETGFRLRGDTVRAADVAFVRAEEEGRTRASGFIPGAPDLAVEVLSPDDRASEVADKVQDWLANGTRSVWVIEPRTRTATIYHPGGKARVVRGGEPLQDDEVVPGFNSALDELFV